MYFVSRKTTMLVLLSSSILAMAGCGGGKGGDQNHSMLAAQSDAIVSNEVQATMAKQLKNITVVKAVPAPASTVTSTVSTNQNTTPAS